MSEVLRYSGFPLLTVEILKHFLRWLSLFNKKSLSLMLLMTMEKTKCISPRYKIFNRPQNMIFLLLQKTHMETVHRSEQNAQQKKVCLENAVTLFDTSGAPPFFFKKLRFCVSRFNNNTSTSQLRLTCVLQSNVRRNLKRKREKCLILSMCRLSFFGCFKPIIPCGGSWFCWKQLYRC